MAHNGPCSTKSAVAVAMSQFRRFTNLTRLRVFVCTSSIVRLHRKVDTLPGYIYLTPGRRGLATVYPSWRRRVKDEAREKVLARLKKVAGQVAGIQRMVEEDRYCVDVLHQVAAVEGALDRVGHLMLASHVETCVASAIESGKPKERKQKLAELMDVFARFGRVRP
jgi:DNA-binding FrmR family transcriptional regulator